MRAMREANMDARRKGGTRERAPAPLPDVPCDFKQAKTDLPCLKDTKGHAGHHRFVESKEV